ncbi:MAG: Rpn family recombination-promoting nuclease/putative transposase, partial [Bdellovibrionaceae bacterium]|nr:Rpn family recombination-promoting nuclease/putative transposase [Pseudobdellovibrionaceae bacterium]
MKKPFKKTQQPIFTHDRFFKTFFNNPTLSKELISLIFSKKELKAYNLNKLKIEKDTFLDKRADLILSLPFKYYPQLKLRLFILLEHKSYYDKNFFNQLLDYQVLLRKQLIQQIGYPQAIIPVLFYHGRKLLKWKSSLQEEDFKSFFSKIPLQSRKNMLNYEPKIIDTKNWKLKESFRCRRFRSYGVIKLLDEIWDLKEEIDSLKVVDVYSGFEALLRGLGKEERKTAELRILEYLRDNTSLDVRIWGRAEELLIEKGILKKGGLMQDVREIIEEKGRWKG